MTLDSSIRRHCIICGLLLFGLGIEALTLYPNPVVFVIAVPLSMFGLLRCMNALNR